MFSPAEPKTKKIFNFLNPKLYLALVFPLLIILSVVQMVSSNRLATEGEDIRIIEKKKQQLSVENNELKNQIATESSYASLADRVIKLNMKKIDKTIVVENPSVAALP